MSLPPYLLGPNPWATMMAQQQLAAAQQAALQAHAAAAAAAPPVPPSQPPKPHHIPEEKIKEKSKLSLLISKYKQKYHSRLFIDHIKSNADMIGYYF